MVEFWGRPSSWLADSCLAMCSHGRKRESSIFSSSFKGTNPIMRVPPSWTHLNVITSQRLHVCIPSHWRLGLQHMNLGAVVEEEGHTNVQSITSVQTSSSTSGHNCKVSLGLWGLLAIAQICVWVRQGEGSGGRITRRFSYQHIYMIFSHNWVPMSCKINTS